jgi:hypothetical protein
VRGASIEFRNEGSARRFQPEQHRTAEPDLIPILSWLTALFLSGIARVHMLSVVNDQFHRSLPRQCGHHSLGIFLAWPIFWLAAALRRATAVVFLAAPVKSVVSQYCVSCHDAT